MIPLPKWATDLVGIPHVPEGRDRLGADCWGIVYLSQKALGREAPAYDGLRLCKSEAQDLADFVERETASERWVKVEEPEPGDVLLFRVRPLNVLAHAGVHVGGDLMLHSLSRFSHITSFRRPHWMRDFEGAYRFHG